MAHKIQIKRGNKADLPTLDAGEFGLCQDTNELFIGNNGNQKIFPPTAPTISDIEGLQTALDGKVDNSRVLTDVPANAKFTDTVTTINGKTGAITKADIVALGIPAQDTVTTINGKTGAITKSDITALGIPAQDTVYTHPATHSADMIVDGTTNKVFTATEKNKLSGIANNANNYTHPTTAGNKHIPSGGSNGKILGYDSDGAAKWIDPPAGVEIANNLTTTVAGKALDATQGKALADLVSTKSGKSVTATVSLTAAGWVGDNAPYTRTYSNAAITATNPIELFAPPDITVEQLEELQAANIQGGTQSAGSIVLRAFGEKPAIDIPVGFIIRGDL
jgi:hypothetical protein